MPASGIELSGRPLIFVPDTEIQRIPFFKGHPISPPVKMSSNSFNKMSSMVRDFALFSNFQFLKIPLYRMYNNDMFDGLRMRFWEPVLAQKLPIYIVSPLFGIIWPGELGGPYYVSMEEMFYVWRQSKLWETTLEIYDRCKCDRVISFLPQSYNNAVFAEGLPWFQYDPDNFFESLHILKGSARNFKDLR